MKKQKDNPINMKDSRKREKVRFSISGGGGILVIGATVVAAAIGAAFVAYRDKRCSKQGGDRTSENGVDEKAEKGLQNLLDPRKLGGSSNNLVIHGKVNQKHETAEDNTDHEDGEKVEDGLKETGDSSTESNVDAEWPSAMIDQMKSGIKEEFAFGSLIETQETNPDRETVEIRSTDGKNEAAYDFSFWNNKLHKHKETEEVVNEALEKSEERTDDVFELEEEEHTSIERRNGNTFVVTSEKSENENYEKRVEDLQTEKEVGEEKGDEFSYVGVEAEQKSKGDCISNTELVEQEAKKVNETANVVNGKENDKGEDEQSALKEVDEKAEDKEEEQGDISYEEVEGRVVEEEEEIFTQNEQRRGDDKGNTEGEDDDKDKGDGILYTELVEEEEAANEVNDTTIVMNGKEKEKEDAQSTLKETDEKDEYEEEQDNITYIDVEGKVVEKEEIFTQNEERGEDDKGNTEAKEDDEDNIILKEIAESETIIHVKEMEKEVEESRINVEHREKAENTGVHLSVNLVEEKEKAEDVTPTEVREENSQKDIDYIHEKDNKVREEEEEKEQDDNKHGEVEGIPVQEEEHDDIRHVEEERIAMEKDNQDKYGDNIGEREVVEEKVEKEEQKGGNDEVDSSEENEDEEQKEEYITARKESYEDMKPVKVVENKAKREENAGNLLLVEKTEDTDILAPIEAGETKGKNEEGKKITLTEHDIADTKSSVNVEIEKDKEGDGIAYVGIEVEEQNANGDIVYTKLGKENKAGDIYNVVHGQQKLKEEDDDVEIIREDDIVYKEIDEKEVVNIELKEVEEKVEKIVVAEERIHVAVNKEEIKEENKDNTILKEIENGKEVQSVEEQKSRGIALSDEVNKEFIDFTQEKDKKVDEEEEKERDDITHAEALLIVNEEEHEDTPQEEEGREAIEKEKEDKYGDDSNINVDVKLVEGHDSINMKNNPKEENKKDETANTELNEVETEEAKKGDVAQKQEINKLDQTQNKNSEIFFDDMNKEISSDSFAAFQNEDYLEKEDEDDEDETENGMNQQFPDHGQTENDNAKEDAKCLVLEKEDEDDEDETENGMNQQFADHGQTENDNAKEDAKCLVLEKEKKTTYMFMDHISKSLFLVVLAMSIAIGILSMFAQQDHLHNCYDHHLPQFCREIFRFFFPSFNQTAKIQ